MDFFLGKYLLEKQLLHRIPIGIFAKSRKKKSSREVSKCLIHIYCLA